MRVMSKFWCLLWTLLLSIGWLLPNHYQPWISFHMDAWIALTLLLAGVATFVRVHLPLVIYRLDVLLAVLVCIPWLQYCFGLILVPGIAWISSVYLLGLFLSVLVGARWEASAAGQLCNALFLAIGIAAILSVGLQLQQWLQIDGIELWKMGGSYDRPYANFGQSNQLGSFLLWGLLALGWGWQSRKMGGPVALLACLFLLFGLALTGSRTAWIGLLVLVIAAWIWRGIWHCQRLPYMVTGLGLYFILCVLSQPDLRVILSGEHAVLSNVLSSESSQHRLTAWAIFADAITRHPWLGFGWYQGVLAQLTVANDHPSLHGLFTSAHNLLLDLMLWTGVPIGLSISVALLVWAWRRVRAVRQAEEALLVLFLTVIGIHAMLELPLHSGYMLLPVGLVLGVLNTRLGARPLIKISRWFLAWPLCIAALLLALIIRDYAQVEASYANFRLERMRIKVIHLAPPDTLLLTQWHDFFKMVDAEPKRMMTIEEMNNFRNVAEIFAGTFFIHQLATALALNHQVEEAQAWLQRSCKTAPEKDCEASQKMWDWQSQKKYPEIAAIPWPVSK